MNPDEIMEEVRSLQAENSEIRAKNIELILKVRRLRESLESALNILEPEQLRIIRSDLSEFNGLNNNQHA